MGGVLSQGHPIAYFSEKLNDSSRVEYTTFEKELYALKDIGNTISAS